MNFTKTVQLPQGLCMMYQLSVAVQQTTQPLWLVFLTILVFFGWSCLGLLSWGLAGNCHSWDGSLSLPGSFNFKKVAPSFLPVFAAFQGAYQLSLLLLMSQWPKHVTWPSPGSLWEGATLKACILRYNSFEAISVTTFECSLLDMDCKICNFNLQMIVRS